MLYLVRMDVAIPTDLPAAEADAVKAREKDYSQRLQRDGRWVHLWRVVGEYANYSVFLACVRLDSVHSISCVRERGSWASSEIRPDA